MLTQFQYDPIRMRTSVVKNVELNHDEKMIVNLIAAQRNDVNRLMHAFLENQNLNTSGYDGTTLLHVAAGWAFLLQHYKIFVRHNSFDAVQFLVEKAGVDVDQKDRRGRTALDHALEAENSDIIQYLKSQNEDLSLGISCETMNWPFSRVTYAESYPVDIIINFLRLLIA